jgi:preprotein translocase subunit SecA
LSLTLPSAFQRRFFQQTAEPLPKGLDRLAKRVGGLWKRRPAVRRRWQRRVEETLALAPAIGALDEAGLDARLAAQRCLVAQAGFPGGLPSAEMLALARETARRTIGLEPYPVQILAVLALLSDYLAEIDTGEGKTLSLALAAGLAAWRRQPCHVLTANDYLAERDARTMGPLYARLGARAACVVGETPPEERRLAYEADVVYTTAKEVVADYLRDRLVLREWDRSGARQFLRHFARAPDGRVVPVQRGLFHAFIDEADNGLIDEAITPLLISRPQENDDLKAACLAAWAVSELLEKGVHYRAYLSERRVEVLPEGERFIAETANFPRVPLWDCPRRQRQFVTLGLEAREFFHLGKQYIRASGEGSSGTSEIVIVDEATGRPMPNRSWKLGLHQIIEAKEGAPLTVPAETIAQISFQTFFRKYERLCGATGTAREIAGEVWQTYSLPTVRIPRHRPNRRRHAGTRIFATTEEKEAAVIAAIRASRDQGQPVLVGTRSVVSSERLGHKLAFQGIQGEILNATPDRGRGGDHPAGRTPRQGHDRHQHGRAGHRYRDQRRRRPPRRPPCHRDRAAREPPRRPAALRALRPAGRPRRRDRLLRPRRRTPQPLPRGLDRTLALSPPRLVAHPPTRPVRRAPALRRAQHRAEHVARRVRHQVSQTEESLTAALGFTRDR